MGVFSDSIRQNVDSVLSKVNKQCYQIAWELFTSIVHLSPSKVNPGPYATGLLVNQWYPQAGTPSNAVGTDTSPNGSASLTRINAMMRGTEFLGKDGKLYLTNNVDHAYRAEVLGWYFPEWSGKSGSDRQGAPYRMVARSLTATKAKFKKVRIK